LAIITGHEKKKTSYKVRRPIRGKGMFQMYNTKVMDTQERTANLENITTYAESVEPKATKTKSAK